MKCKQCGTENLYKANYCKSCGAIFTDEEKHQAYSESDVAKIEKLNETGAKAKKLIDILTLDFITKNFFVRIALLVVPFIVAMIFKQDATHFYIAESGQYGVHYNTTTEEYFVEVNDKEMFDLLLSVPSDTEYIRIWFQNEDSIIDYDENFSLDVNIFLEVRNDGYYVIEAISEDDVQTIIMYIL